MGQDDLTIRCRPFAFRQLIEAHGWVHLAPFEWSPEDEVLRYRILLGGGRTIPARISYRKAGRGAGEVRVAADPPGALSEQERELLQSRVARMLRLEEDYVEFHELCRHDADLAYVAACKGGGMLRCPTAFEDLVKTICTTNCDWRNTKRMCRAFCQLAEGAFPTPEIILQFSERDLQERIAVGYRARTILAVAQKVAEGELALDPWAGAGQFDRVGRELKKIWGIGEYTVNHMLVLLGCFDFIPVDSEVIRYLRQTHFGGEAVPAKEAVAPYAKYGRFRYLAYKFKRIGRKANYTDKA